MPRQTRQTWRNNCLQTTVISDASTCRRGSMMLSSGIQDQQLAIERLNTTVLRQDVALWQLPGLVLVTNVNRIDQWPMSSHQLYLLKLGFRDILNRTWTTWQEPGKNRALRWHERMQLLQLEAGVVTESNSNLSESTELLAATSLECHSGVLRIKKKKKKSGTLWNFISRKAGASWAYRSKLSYFWQNHWTIAPDRCVPSFEGSNQPVSTCKCP